MRLRTALAPGAALPGAAAAAWSRWPPARPVYLGGPILTIDANDRVVEALGVEGARIAAVGSREEVLAWAAGRARVVDLGGHALLPGFIDAHGHFPGSGITAVYVDLSPPPVGDVASLDGVVERLRARAAQKAPGEWVVGWSYDDTLLDERRHPTRADLDRASSAHPIVAWHISGHLCAVNSAALEKLGIDAATPDPPGGRIRRDA